MATRDAYTLRSILGTHYLAPVGRDLPGDWKVFELSDEGAWIWKELAAQDDEELLGRAYAQRFGKDAADAASECHEFLETLGCMGLR